MFNALASHTALTTGVFAAVAMLASSAAMAATPYEPSVLALNQKEKAQGVSITYAYFPNKGTLDIYTSNARGGVGKDRLAQVAMSPGAHRNIKITLKGVKPGTKLWAVAQQPDGHPFRDQGVAPAEQSFKVL